MQKKSLKKILNNDHEIIIIYSLHTPFIKAAIDLKEINPSIKICLIVPDLPEFMGGRNNIALTYLKKKEKILLDNLLKKIDSFVLLSDYMCKPLNVGERPWIRIEGIFNAGQNEGPVKKEIFKTILYTGTLAKRYGILNLLNAFSLIKGKEYRLWICGIGDAISEINERSKKDNRIINFGQLSREEVMKLQEKATVLVNPRTSEGEFTRYSFPSKIMEYLASGTPCIMYRLTGIPGEYFKYCFIPENETVIELYKTIILVCEKNRSELHEFGMKGKRFILENKTPKDQGKKIYDMLTRLTDIKTGQEAIG